MDLFIRTRKRQWKTRLAKKVKDSDKIDKAVELLLGEYIYYSRNFREIKSRIRKVAGTIEAQVKGMQQTRTDIKKEKLQEIQRRMNYFRKKMRKFEVREEKQKLEKVKRRMIKRGKIKKR
jgi:hypothetical protein